MIATVCHAWFHRVARLPCDRVVQLCFINKLTQTETWSISENCIEQTFLMAIHGAIIILRIFTARIRSVREGNVFTRLSVSLLNSRVGVPCKFCPWCTGVFYSCIQEHYGIGHMGPPPLEVVSEETPPEVVAEEDPQKWWWKKTPPEVVEEDPPRSGGRRGPPINGGGRGPAEKYCYASAWYALEKRLPCSRYLSHVFGSFGILPNEPMQSWFMDESMRGVCVCFSWPEY